MTLRTKKILLQYSILLFAVFPLIPNSLKGIPVIILLIVSLFFFKNHKVNIKKFVINSSLYFIYLFSLIYTSNLSEAFNKLETTLSILVLPLIFYIILSKKVFDEDLKQEFMKLFMFSTSLFSVIIIIAILLDTTTVYYKDFYTNKYRMIVEVVPLIGQHPIYASLFLAISILFLMNIYF